MTHPYGRSKRRPRDSRAELKRYRLTPAGLAWLEQRAPAGALVATCIYCGCTDEHACPDGCYWVIVDHRTHRGICSNCTSIKRDQTWSDDDVAAKNRRAFAQLRTLKNALALAAWRMPPAHSKP